MSLLQHFADLYKKGDDGYHHCTHTVNQSATAFFVCVEVANQLLIPTHNIFDTLATPSILVGSALIGGLTAGVGGVLRSYADDPIAGKFVANFVTGAYSCPFSGAILLAVGEVAWAKFTGGEVPHSTIQTSLPALVSAGSILEKLPRSAKDVASKFKNGVEEMVFGRVPFLPETNSGASSIKFAPAL